MIPIRMMNNRRIITIVIRMINEKIRLWIEMLLLLKSFVFKSIVKSIWKQKSVILKRMLNWIVKIDFFFSFLYFTFIRLTWLSSGIFCMITPMKNNKNGNYYVLSNINNFANNTSINVTELQIVLYEPKRMWSEHIEPTHLMVHVMWCDVMLNAILWCSVHIIYVNRFFCLIINHFSFWYQRTKPLRWIELMLTPKTQKNELIHFNVNVTWWW